MSLNEFERIGQAMAKEQAVSLSQMFGKPCLKLETKAFAAFFQEAMVFKLGKENMNDLMKKYPGSQLFDPSGKGRAMKDWIQVPTEFQEDWPRLAQEAAYYIS